MDIRELDKKYVANTYNRFPPVLVSGSGATFLDADGKRYIDFGSGIGVNCFGAADPEWVAAVTAQLGKLQHTSNLYYTEPCVKLAQALCEKTGMKRVFFGNSGAEANECAIKTARKWAFDACGDESRSTVITLLNSFHGRTLATLAATGQDVFHTKFGPFPAGFAYADPADPDSLRALAAKGDACAVMIECVQGEGGINVLSADFIAAVKEVCEKYGLLLICDEVQTGNGRTGKYFSYMHFGLAPDIVSTAKGLGGGLPIGACLLGKRVENTLDAGSHGSTFGGNPVSCAGALSVVERLTDEFLAGVAAKGEYIRSRLAGAEGVEGVSGLGLMLGITCAKPLAEVSAACLEKGLLTLTAKTKLRLLPPLNISDEELAEGMDRLLEALK
ncbi:MAG: aspartate aminotransferase family protein [Oscillospiraceae bacterium]|nr:aspartate aminotransferase family protein [Oscillospiraceae bacterium]